MEVSIFPYGNNITRIQMECLVGYGILKSPTSIPSILPIYTKMMCPVPTLLFECRIRVFYDKVKSPYNTNNSKISSFLIVLQQPYVVEVHKCSSINFSGLMDIVARGIYGLAKWTTLLFC